MKQPAVRWLAAVVAAAACIVLPPFARADAKGPEQAANTEVTDNQPTRARARRDTYPFRGVVASVDTAAQTVTLAGKDSRRLVHYTAQTRLIREGQPAVIDDLKAGETVGGTLRKTPDGREEAVMIRIGLKPQDSSGTSSRKKSKPAGDPVAE